MLFTWVIKEPRCRRRHRFFFFCFIVLLFGFFFVQIKSTMLQQFEYQRQIRLTQISVIGAISLKFKLDTVFFQ